MSAGRKILIYVRGRKYEAQEEQISYDEVVNLGYPNGKPKEAYIETKDRMELIAYSTP